MAKQKHNSSLVEAAYNLLLEKKKPMKIGQLYELLQAKNTPKLTDYHALSSALHNHIKYWKDFAVIKRIGSGYFTINEKNSSALRRTKIEIEKVETQKIRRMRDIHLNVLSRILNDFPELRNGIEEIHWSIFIDIYFHNLSFIQAANKYNLSRERIRQITKSVLNIVNERAKRAFSELRHFKAIVSELRLQIASQREALYILKSRTIYPETLTPSLDILLESIEQLDLPMRVQNVLRSLNIKTIGELVTTPKEKLLDCQNFGRKSLFQLELELKMVGLKW